LRLKQREKHPPEIVAHLRSPPALWADSGPDARLTITTAIFARTDVLGFERVGHELTSDAIALVLDAVLPAVFELRDQVGEYVPAAWPLEVGVLGPADVA